MERAVAHTLCRGLSRTEGPVLRGSIGMNAQIRDFLDCDYDALAEIWSAAVPLWPQTARELRYRDDSRGEGYAARKWVYALQGDALGVASYAQQPWSFHPDRYEVSVLVRPERERSGVGRALWAHLNQELARLHAQVITSWVPETSERGAAFAVANGFVEVSRERSCRLDLAEFDASPYAGAEERLRQAGIVLKGLDLSLIHI